MVRTSRFLATFLAALAAAWQPSAAQAATDEVQLWLMFDAAMPLDQQTELKFLVMPRFRDSARGEDQLVLRAAIDHELSEALTIGGGLTYVVGPESLRPYQQVELAHGNLSLRFRLEEITGQNVDRLGLRERVQLRYTIKLGDGTSASVAGEWIDSVRSQNRDTLPARDQWRASANLRHRFGTHLRAGLGYTLIVAPARYGLPARHIHAPLLTAGWTF